MDAGRRGNHRFEQRSALRIRCAQHEAERRVATDEPGRDGKEQGAVRANFPGAAARQQRDHPSPTLQPERVPRGLRGRFSFPKVES